MSVRKFLCFTATVLVLATSVCASEKKSLGAEFPGTSSELMSPDGTLRVINRDPDDSRDSHTIALVGQIGGDEKVLHKYGRHVLAIWSPDSKYLMITDYAESTDATCFFYHVATNSKVDLGKEARRSSEQISGLLGNEHA
jgi:Tol biopolymer transport system component